MQNKKIIWLFILSLIGTIAGYILTNSIKYGLCIYEGLSRDAACLNFYERVGDPLLYGMGALAIVFLFLIFTPQALAKWKKFAIWYVPIAALIFIFYPDPGSGDFLAPYPEQVFRWLSAAYVVISVALIALNTKKGVTLYK